MSACSQCERARGLLCAGRALAIERLMELAAGDGEPARRACVDLLKVEASSWCELAMDTPAGAPTEEAILKALERLGTEGD